MRLPKEKVIFAVDFIPVEAGFWRSMPDSWIDEWEGDLAKRVLAMDWDKLIPSHPGPWPSRQQAGCREPAAVHE